MSSHLHARSVLPAETSNLLPVEQVAAVPQILSAHSGEENDITIHCELILVSKT